MALTEHHKSFLDLSPSRPVAAELMQIQDELDRVQVDIDAGRMAEARAKFVKMDRALRETPRALVLRAKASPSRDSHEMIAGVAREQVKRTTDIMSRIYLATALALCGDAKRAESALPSALGLSAFEAAARREAVKLIGSDPEAGPDRRSMFEKFVDRWLGARG